jgi:hypothetical protein
MTVLVTRNDTEDAFLRDQFLAVRRWHGLALLRWYIGDLRLIGATATD